MHVVPSNVVSQKKSVFHLGFSCLAFGMALIVRGSSNFAIPLSVNLLSVSSAFVTVAALLFINVDLSLSFRSWTASPSCELSTVRTYLLVVSLEKKLLVQYCKSNIEANILLE
jgi:hypothetical protein